MTNTKISLLVVGGLALSYALVALDTVGISAPKEADVSGDVKHQEQKAPIRIQDSPFAKGLFR